MSCGVSLIGSIIIAGVSDLVKASALDLYILVPTPVVPARFVFTFAWICSL